MKNALLIFYLSFGLTLSAQQKHKCLYVTTADAGVYKEMQTNMPILTLQIGDIVGIEEYTGKFETMRLKGKKVKFEWVKVVYGNKLDVNEEDRTNQYMPSVYLSPYLEKLPSSLIKDYNFLMLENEQIINVNYTSRNNNNGETEGAVSDSINCICFGYLKKEHPITYSSYVEEIEETLAPDDSRLDTLKYFFEIEEVEKNISKKKIKNPYGIDTTPVKMLWLEKEDDNDIRLVDRFYLFINSGKDSVLLNAEPNEYGSAMAFVGQLPTYNKYLLAWESFFYNGYTLIDKTTGEKTDFTHGKPFISSGGKFVVDYYGSVDYELNEVYGTTVSLSTINDSAGLKRHITVNFRNFMPLDEAFWVSENELVLAIQPIDNFTYHGKEAIKNNNRQYIKLKVVYFDK